MKIRCIAVDDEPLAVKKISGYILQTPFLELVAECRSAIEALDILNNHTIHLMFIDINMPDLSGMDFVKSLTNKPYIVFTTAYSEYAIDGFKVDAADYLLKPVSYGSFLKAANKVKDLINLTTSGQQESISTAANHLFVKSDYKLLRIELDEIRYVESMREYIKIYLVTGKPVITMMSMKTIEDKLPPDRFMRVHRSFIVNLSKITVIERSRIVFDGKVYIPVSDQYKSNFQSYINKSFPT